MKVLCLCLGNICRSPAAEAVLRTKAALRGLDLSVDSAGTGNWHIGAPPDARMQRVARERGYDLSGLRGRQIVRADLKRFDLILAMDARNLADARAIGAGTARMERFLDLAGIGGDVPDPWFTGDFEGVLTLIERASDAILDDLSR